MKTHRSTQLFLYCSGGEHNVKCVRPTLEKEVRKEKKRGVVRFLVAEVDPGGHVVIILATGSEIRRFKPGWGRWIFSEHKNPGYDFLRKGCKAVGPVSYIYGT